MSKKINLYLCNVCRSRQYLFFDYHDFHYYRCKKCGLVSTFPLPTTQMIEKHYAKRFKKGNYNLLNQYSQQYKKVHMQFISILNKHLIRCGENMKNKKILDIGCFTGDFLELAKEKGADVYGIELQKNAVALANSKLGNNKVLQKDVMNNYSFGNKKFDIITMFGLIEHLTNPSQLIRKSYCLLNSGGTIMIQTPNSSSLFAKVLNKYWPPYSPIEHIHLFSQLSLKYLLEKNGFRIITTKNHIKLLPIRYVNDMLDNFGSEFRILFKPFQFLMLIFGAITLPFYIGEMIIIAKKK